MYSLLAFVPLLLALQDEAIHWVQDSFADFRGGEFSASGQNLFVTRDGTVRTIQRFDLNRDGYIDLVFNSSHDLVNAVPPTCFELPRGASCELPAPGTRLAAAGDFNRDGYADLVLAPNNDGVTPRRYMLLFWGGPEGWSPRRMTSLLSIDPRALQVGDLDGDGWPEIIVLNGSRWAKEDGPEAVLRIYRGSEQGYRQEVFRDVVLESATDMKVRDLDGDGRPEVLVLAQKPARVLVFRNGSFDQPMRLETGSAAASQLLTGDLNGDGRPEIVVAGTERQLVSRDPTTGVERYRNSGLLYFRGGVPQKLAAPPATAVIAADLDGDHKDDLVLADATLARDSVRIVWGDRARPGATLPVRFAAALAAGDLNGDGKPDLAVAVAHGEGTFQGTSLVFYGDGRGGFRQAPHRIPTADPTDVVIAPGPRLVFCNNRTGRINEDVPALVYWGGAGGFEPKRVSRYSIRSGYASVAADLNNDGNVDLVLLSIVHAVSELHPGLGLNILWGGPEGLDDSRRTVLPEFGLMNLGVADFDRDGYLDLLGGAVQASPAGEPPHLAIWYGGPNGFQRERRRVIPVGVWGEGQSAIADFNKDGWLDIAIGRQMANCVTVFWGGEDGFSPSRQSTWPLVAANDLKAADLDRDGWLDLVVHTHWIPGTLEADFGSYIFWGGPGGFQPTNAQRLSAHSSVGIAIADWDGDGYLDVYLPNYHYGNTRESIASYLYWGGPQGFRENRRTDLVVDAAHGALAADFDGDGRLDLAVACHTRNGNHLVDSRVYFNDGNRFRNARFTGLPTLGTHYMQRVDMGNVYDRRYRETCTSSVFTWKDARRSGRLAFRAQAPGGGKLLFEVRMAPAPEELGRAAWTPVAGDGSFSAPAAARAMQYRATFISGNGDAYPALDRVEIDLRR